MGKRLILLALAAAICFSSVTGFFPTVADAAGETEGSQFTILFEKDGAWKDGDGNEIFLPASSKLGDSTPYPNAVQNIEMWHYSGGYWGINGYGRINDNQFGGNYNRFNELMKGLKYAFEFRMPPVVRTAIASGEGINVAISAGEYNRIPLGGIENRNREPHFQHRGFDRQSKQCLQCICRAYSSADFRCK